MSVNSPVPPRPHIYEFDLLRAVTAITVVGVHTLAFTYWLYATAEGAAVHYAVLDAIHWTRNIFLFITAFVLTYVYYGKPFSTRRFWIKRSIGVLLPYSIWSIAYTWSSNVPHEPLVFAKAALLDILTGNASYQLYYILLTIQLYLVFPLFLRFLRLVAQHPWTTLAISFTLEMVFTYVSFEFLQRGAITSTPLGQNLDTFQNRFLLTYQFYIVLGGLAALNLEHARAFLLSHGRWVLAAFALALAAALANYAFEIGVYHSSFVLASTVLQPAITVYSLAVIVSLCWLGAVWVSRSGKNGLPLGYALWHQLSDASFGIYLAHAFILTAVFVWVLPRMPADWPAGLRIFLSWLLTASSAALVSIVLQNIPVLSRLVGRTAEWHRPKSAIALQRRFANRLPHGAKVEPER